MTAYKPNISAGIYAVHPQDEIPKDIQCKMKLKLQEGLDKAVHEATINYKKILEEYKKIVQKLQLYKHICPSLPRYSIIEGDVMTIEQNITPCVAREGTKTEHQVANNGNIEYIIRIMPPRTIKYNFVTNEINIKVNKQNYYYEVYKAILHKDDDCDKMWEIVGHPHVYCRDEHNNLIEPSGAVCTSPEFLAELQELAYNFDFKVIEERLIQQFYFANPNGDPLARSIYQAPAIISNVLVNHFNIKDFVVNLNKTVDDFKSELDAV